METNVAEPNKGHHVYTIPTAATHMRVVIVQPGHKDGTAGEIQTFQIPLGEKCDMTIFVPSENENNNK